MKSIRFVCKYPSFIVIIIVTTDMQLNCRYNCLQLTDFFTETFVNIHIEDLITNCQLVTLALGITVTCTVYCHITSMELVTVCKY